ncbi:MAG: ion transporter [Cyclobacteriaceae bacterium]|nr:ion transporter [Cyclobacteriaceae bacterium]
MSTKNLKEKLYIIIFEADTWWGKFFDVALLVLILLSVVTVALESVKSLNAEYGLLFDTLEWAFTALFTIEYILRLYASTNRVRYAFSFFGIIDLISTLPAYLGLILTGAHSLIVLRSFRLLRVFRIFKLARFIGEASQLQRALKASRPKIIVFVTAVSIIVMIMGTLMYIIEGGKNGFTSIPRSVYWAIVTLTTVGYGDIAPVTVLGQTVAAFIMILGYAIIAVPTGIVTAELGMAVAKERSSDTRVCANCNLADHDADASYCKNCGEELPQN